MTFIYKCLFVIFGGFFLFPTVFLCMYKRIPGIAAVKGRLVLAFGLGGVSALQCIQTFETIGAALTVFAFFLMLSAAAFFDLETMEIPDIFPAFIAVISVVSVFTMPELPVWSRLAGGVCASVPMLFLALSRPGAFGGGDIKLMTAGGLVLGFQGAIISAGLSILFGGGYALYLLIAGKCGRKAEFAFGPFLCIGMSIGTLYGRELAAWYTGG